ncbi:MAG: stage III sporulation protein AA [Oscillospiraceae bacterium]|nr:stage III sporulation protein AA [Oscillospiraceae bacterium]
MENILAFFSENIAQILKSYLSPKHILEVEEIRIRANNPIIIKNNDGEIILDYIITTDDLLRTLEKICENSIYTYQNQICNGFITVKGGHRVGITGNAVVEGEKIININYISSLNFRVAKQILDCSNSILKYVTETATNTVKNTLIVSSPGAGKTTILRDLVRKISSGFNGFKGLTVGLVDERGEIAAMYKGIPQNNIGIRTDVIDNVPKSEAMKLLIRSMAPQVIVADEIGGIYDVEIINYAVCSGVKGIFTAHGATFTDLKLNHTLNTLIKDYIFERIIFLENKKVREIDYFNPRTLKYEKLGEKTACT